MWHLLRRNRAGKPAQARLAAGEQPQLRAFHTQTEFRELLRLERKRAERSQRRSIVMVLRCCDHDGSCKAPGAIKRVAGPLVEATRDTDIVGWLSTGHMMGVIFTEIGVAQEKSVAKTLFDKVGTVLSQALSAEQLSAIRVALQAFPDGDNRIAEGKVEFNVYPNLAEDGGAVPVIGGGDRELGLNPVIG
jgi:hypothetical protein